MNLWDKISNIGLDDQSDIKHIRFVHFFNRLILLVTCFSGILLITNIVIQNYYYAYIQAVAFTIRPISFWLNHKKWFRASAYFMFLTILVNITYSTIAHNNIGVEVILIPACYAAFLSFKRNSDSWFVFALLILSYMTGQIIKYYNPPIIMLNETFRLIAYYTNAFISFVLSGLIIITFKIVIEDYENTLLTQKQKIEAHDIEITESITYATRIQQAKLPDKKEIFASLPQCFIFSKPKDIVSGDFYFFHKMDHSAFLAAADCTGHGVPGALMSMIGYEKLLDAIAESSDTSEILNKLNKGLKKSLRQDDNKDSTRDGMDIALCNIDLNNRVVKYAGANRPIWIIRKGENEVTEIKATKKAIGGLTEDDQRFDTHVINLKEGDTFYLSSDGFGDTFGGKEGKKLTTKHFKQILLSIQKKNMKEQESYLENFLEEWKDGLDPVDDVLVIGVRL